MTFDRLIENCQALEKTISILIKSNSAKQGEIDQLQNKIFDESQASLTEILEKESSMLKKLDSIKLKKNELDITLKQYNDVNEKLSDLVAIVQKSDRSDDEDIECKNDDMSLSVAESLEEYNQLKQECSKTRATVSQLSGSLNDDQKEVKAFIVEKQGIANDLLRNDANIRLLEQQNKFAEQQFDLIINQLPWEPLPDRYIEDLEKSPVQSIKDIAVTLKLQKNEIEELTESLNAKKTKKLKVLEELYCELNNFIQKRDEAVLITRVLDG